MPVPVLTRRARSGVAAALAAAMVVAGECGLAAEPRVQPQTHALLDVPYLTQTPELCGGAAVAMVLRYWGERDVFAQDFAQFVASSEGGIRTDVLTSAVRDRGWQPIAIAADAAAGSAPLQSEIDRGRPVIALIEVGPHDFHYVVIVGLADQKVVLHDPARAPFRVLPWAEFDRAWAAAGRWTMVILPSGGRARPPAVPALEPFVPSPGDAAAATPCRALVDRGVQFAIAGDRESAEQALMAATALCPADAAPWRELAGLRFSQSRWVDARDLALAATRLAPDDAYAWQLLAASRYLMGDRMGALDAWNRSSEPRLDAMEIHGAVRTRQPIVVRAAGLQPRQLLTSDAFERALRRLRELPIASAAQMKYEPADGGLAKLDVFIDERPLVPHGWIVLATLGARAIVHDEVRVDVAGLSGAGELMTAAWRWSAGRPRVSFTIALPSPHWLPGVVAFDASWERQSFAPVSAAEGGAVTSETRRRAGVHIADWRTRSVRWEAGVALDRLPAHGDRGGATFDPPARDYLAIDGSLDVRLARDRVAVVLSGGWWAPFAGGARFGTAGMLAAWRSTTDRIEPVWSAVAEVETVSRVAPRSLWPGAGTGQARSALIRAHPLLSGGTLDGPVFGRRLAHGSFEYARPLMAKIAGGLSIAGFVDAAQAWRRAGDTATSPLFVDAGLGIRLRAPGSAGAIRIDVAHGLRGGGTSLSAGWGVGWPR